MTLNTIIAINEKNSVERIYPEKGFLFSIFMVFISLRELKNWAICWYHTTVNNKVIIQTEIKLYCPKKPKIDKRNTKAENQSIVDRIFWNTLFCLLKPSIFWQRVFQKKYEIPIKNIGNIEKNTILKKSVNHNQKDKSL